MSSLEDAIHASRRTVVVAEQAEWTHRRLAEFCIAENSIIISERIHTPLPALPLDPRCLGSKLASVSELKASG